MDPEVQSNVIKISAATAVVGTTGYVAYNVYRKYANGNLIKKNQENLKSKKESLLSKLEKLQKPFNNIDKITNLKLKDLMKSLEVGEYQPIDVVQAYQAKALLMDKEYNFITDINPYYEDDLANIETLKKGTLKGIPVSVKESFTVKGCNTTFGMVNRISGPSDRDDIMVRTLRMLGMIPFVTTNTSQSGLSMYSSNPVFGETLNPRNKTKTCGGGSGGEGAILASEASILGLGTDVGGSIRIPASYCGVFALKPTTQRFSQRQTNSAFAKQNIINIAIGPMARQMEDLVIFFKAMACGDLYHLDPYCPPLCFNDKIFEKKKLMKIGYYTNLGGNQLPPVPAVVRAVGIAKKALESAGHSVMEFNIPDVNYAIFDLYLQIIFSDGGSGLLDHFLQNNPVDPTIAPIINVLKMPNFLKSIFSYAMWPFNKNYSSILYCSGGMRSVYKMWELNERAKNYRELLLSKWQELKLDGLICPISPITAPPLKTTPLIFDIIGYSAIFNLIDYPAGSIPMTTVNPQDIDLMLKTYPKDTSIQKQVIELQKDSVGMPVGVQCVAMLWREETCLRIMREITEFAQ